MFESSILAAEGERRIFEGELVTVRGGRARVRGFHLEDATVMRENGISIIEETRTASDSRGVYMAQIELEGVKRRPAYSGFFPKSWTREQVRSAIAEAYQVRRPRGWVDAGSFYEGRTREGIKVVMELDESGRVLDAFPQRGGSSHANRRRDAQLRVSKGIRREHPLVCGRCHRVRVLVCPKGHDWPARWGWWARLGRWGRRHWRRLVGEGQLGRV